MFSFLLNSVCVKFCKTFEITKLPIISEPFPNFHNELSQFLRNYKRRNWLPFSGPYLYTLSNDTKEWILTEHNEE